MYKKYLYTLIAGNLLFLCQGKEPVIIAHRGASDIAPENTKSAIVLAWQMGASAVECDIHLTKDAQIVLIHDPNTLRTAGIDISVKDANYSELKQLDVGSFKDTKYAGEKIPLLADIIRTIPSDKKKKLFIEIKCGPEILPHLNQVIENSEKKEQIVFIGFNIDTVSQLKKVMPDIPAFWLVMTDKDKKTGKWIPHNSDLITKTKKCGIDGLGLHWAGLNKSFVQKAHKESLGVHVWTVDKIEIARKLKKIGVDGITSNKLNLLMQEINSN